jgi:hypothetical protein
MEEGQVRKREAPQPDPVLLGGDEKRALAALTDSKINEGN